MSKKRGKNRLRNKPAQKAAQIQEAAPPPAAIPAKSAVVKKPFPIKTAAIAAAMILCIAGAGQPARLPVICPGR